MSYCCLECQCLSGNTDIWCLINVTGKVGLATSTSDNGKRLLDFAQGHDMIITNTVFQHKRIYAASWYPHQILLQIKFERLCIYVYSFQAETRVMRSHHI